MALLIQFHTKEVSILFDFIMLLHFVIGIYQIPRSLRDKNKRKQKKKNTYLFFSYLTHSCFPLYLSSCLIHSTSRKATSTTNTKVGKDGARIFKLVRQSIRKKNPKKIQFSINKLITKNKDTKTLFCTQYITRHKIILFLTTLL